MAIKTAKSPEYVDDRVSDIDDSILALRGQLLDVSKRNRLTNTPIGKSSQKQLDIDDERSDEVFRILFREGKKMTFDPHRENKAGISENTEPGDQPTGSPLIESQPADTALDGDYSEPVFVPEEVLLANKQLSAHHVDTKLQTKLTAEALQRRLLSLYRETRTMEEEQGVSVLFLALGFLKWYESESSEIERFAPLILLPVDLERDTVRGRFKLKIRDDDLEINLSLRAMLHADFGIYLPDFPTDENWNPSLYFERISSAIAAQPRWSILLNTIELGFYSFGKFLMWKDLEQLDSYNLDDKNRNLLSQILIGSSTAPASILTREEKLDELFPEPKDLCHVLDADTSQALIIDASRKGHNLVVQGPPGTGKSQTIANIISAAAHDGKRVLFVAEKKAALDVVHARLEKLDLDPLCLELHSHKANRKKFYAELKKTLELGEPNIVGEHQYSRVREVRDQLNHLSDVLHQVDDLTGETPYNIIGRLSLLNSHNKPIPDFKISGSENWSREEYDARLDALVNFAKLTDDFGSETQHIWRGVSTRLNPIERQRLAVSLRSLHEKTELLISVLESGGRFSYTENFDMVDSAAKIIARLDTFADMPQQVPQLLASDNLLDHHREVLNLYQQMANFQKLKTQLMTEVTEHAFDLPWDEVRLNIAAHGKSLFRAFNGQYRSSMAKIKAVQLKSFSKDHKVQLAHLDRLIELRKLHFSIEKLERIGVEALPGIWKGEDTDISILMPALEWMDSQISETGSGTVVRQRVGEAPDKSILVDASRKLTDSISQWRGNWESVCNDLKLDIQTAFDSSEIETVRLSEVSERVHQWTGNLVALEEWHRLRTVAQEVTDLGMNEIRRRLACGDIATDDARSTLEYIRAESVWNRFTSESSELAAVDGKVRTDLIEDFRSLDTQLQSLAAQEVALTHFKSLPKSTAGNIGIVRGECNKKTRHMPLRKLLEKAADAVAAIKPVFLMSPLSVAQFLPPGKFTFDLLLVDEASQVRPVDAIGSVLRAKQIVVVGDQKQLPPSSFFERSVSTEDETESEDVDELLAAQVGDMESLLSLCDARGFAGGMLRWHYRSQHPSLIEVSNHEFYESKLVFPPSPYIAGRERGLMLEYVTGVYQRGRKRNNPIEAQAVVEKVLDHARKRPDVSLGVVAFSVSQRDTILDQLEFKRAEFPELEAFCKEEGSSEPFFVKNLENVQGDERDVIFISVGYGKDADGYMSQSFGPVSNEGGERRLNVIFTRAKKQCIVFSSIKHSDIRLDAIKHDGPRVLKRFLKFAETGEIDIPVYTGAEADSPFEESVAHELRQRGYQVEHQIGSSGFQIDLAVVDPDDAGRFLLAIECDGARYHSSSWARERDRLRQTVLEIKGWKFHRIWSTDWFYERPNEIRKLLEAIERARTVRTQPPKVTPPKRIPRVARSNEMSSADVLSEPYYEANFDVPHDNYGSIHEVPIDTIEELVERIVKTEGPIHIEEVGRRLSQLWGYKRTGNRIQKLVSEAANNSYRQERIKVVNRFFLIGKDASENVTVRNRSKISSSSLRNADMLPPIEIRAAVLQIVEKSFGISIEDCRREVDRALGFKASYKIRHQLFDEQIRVLIDENQLIEQDNILRIAESTNP